MRIFYLKFNPKKRGGGKVVTCVPSPARFRHFQYRLFLSLVRLLACLPVVLTSKTSFSCLGVAALFRGAGPFSHWQLLDLGSSLPFFYPSASPPVAHTQLYIYIYKYNTAHAS